MYCGFVAVFSVSFDGRSGLISCGGICVLNGGVYGGLLECGFVECGWLTSDEIDG